MGDLRLALAPITLKLANHFVAAHHRHNGRTARDGGKWAVACVSGGVVVGVAIVGNPLSATLMDGWTAEVLRVCTADPAPTNSCSMLYGACWRCWRAMGGRRMVTYTLTSESGTSLRAAGFRLVAKAAGRPQGWGKRDHLHGTRANLPVIELDKYRWEITTNDLLTDANPAAKYKPPKSENGPSLFA